MCTELYGNKALDLESRVLNLDNIVIETFLRKAFVLVTRGLLQRCSNRLTLTRVQLPGSGVLE